MLASLRDIPEKQPMKKHLCGSTTEGVWQVFGRNMEREVSLPKNKRWRLVCVFVAQCIVWLYPNRRTNMILEMSAGHSGVLGSLVRMRLWRLNPLNVDCFGIQAFKSMALQYLAVMHSSIPIVEKTFECCPSIPDWLCNYALYLSVAAFPKSETGDDFFLGASGRQLTVSIQVLPSCFWLLSSVACHCCFWTSVASASGWHLCRLEVILPLYGYY